MNRGALLFVHILLLDMDIVEVYTFDMVSLPILPLKTKAPLLVNTNTILSFTISFQRSFLGYGGRVGAVFGVQLHFAGGKACGQGGRTSPYLFSINPCSTFSV